MLRSCTTCLSRGKQVRAKYVATDCSDFPELLWYECGEHDPRDNLADVERKELIPIDEFLASLGVPAEYLDQFAEEVVPPTIRNNQPIE